MANIIADRTATVELTKTQKRIAEYFIKNRAHIAPLSSLKIAQEIGVSEASIIRFARALGYEGFTDLKADLYRELAENSVEGFSSLSLTERMALRGEQRGDSDLPLEFMELMVHNLESSFNQNPKEAFEKVADILIQADHRCVMGLRSCIGVADFFARSLSFMLPNTFLVRNSLDSAYEIMDLREGDTVVVFVFGRYYKEDLAIFRQLKAQHATICLITDDRFGPLTEYAEAVLIVEPNSLSLFNSAIGTTMVAEYVLTLISRKVPIEERLTRYDELTADLRI